MLHTVGISVDTSGVVFISFSIPWRVVDADVKDPTSSEGWERRLDGGGFGDSLCGALGLRAWILLQDGVKGCFGASANVQHVDSRRELVGDLVSERMDISNQVS